jgi:hypothetical protein
MLPCSNGPGGENVWHHARTEDSTEAVRFRKPGPQSASPDSGGAAGQGQGGKETPSVGLSETWITAFGRDRSCRRRTGCPKRLLLTKVQSMGSEAPIIRANVGTPSRCPPRKSVPEGLMGRRVFLFALDDVPLERGRMVGKVDRHNRRRHLFRRRRHQPRAMMACPAKK